MGQASAVAKRLRANLTDAERRLWSLLRRRQFLGWRFRRQAPIGPYVVDFFCSRAKLIIELDGGQHVARKQQDERRTAWLTERGYRVIRFWNNDLFANEAGVLAELSQALSGNPDA